MRFPAVGVPALFFPFQARISRIAHEAARSQRPRLSWLLAAALSFCLAAPAALAQATPSISYWPVASPIVAGQALSNSTLTDGIASVPGTFAWTAPATVPPAPLISDALPTGTQTESVTFTPTDLVHYSPVSNPVSVIVAPAVYWVNTTTDDLGSPNASNCPSSTTAPGAGSCSLRDALLAAVGDGVTTYGGIIYFDPTVYAPGAKTRYKASLTMEVPENTAIIGPGVNSAIVGPSVPSNTGPMFHIAAEDNYLPPGTIPVTAWISGITIGNAIGGGTGTSGGAGIANFGTLTLSSCVVTNNKGTQGYGGGLLNSGTLVVDGCTFSNNTSEGTITNGYGGGLFNAGPALVLHSTFLQNAGIFSCSGCGGGAGAGIYNGGPGSLTLIDSTVALNGTSGTNVGQGGGAGILSDGNIVVENSTITGNSQTGGFSYGGGFYCRAGSCTVSNTIIAGNTDVSGCPDICVESSIPGSTPDVFTDGGYNLIGDDSGPAQFNSPTGFTNGVNNTMVGTSASPINANLSAPQTNSVGSLLATAIPLPGSPALCAGSYSLVPYGYPNDERGFPWQPTGGYCSAGSIDIGAVQSNYTGVAFVTQPHDTQAPRAITPAPTVGVYETNTNLPAGSNTDAVGGASVTLTPSGGTYSGSPFTAAAATTSPFLASFSTLTSSTTANGIDLVTGAIPVYGDFSLAPVTSASYDVYGGTTHFVVSMPSNVNVGSPFSVTVTAEDANGHIVEDLAFAVHFTSSDPSATLPADYLFVSADAGVHTFTNGVTLATEGSQTVTVALVSTPSTNGTATATVAGPAAAITATSGTPQSATVNQTFSSWLVATVTDAGANPVSGVSVTFTAPGAGPTGTFSNSTNTITLNTDSNGQVSVPFTANTTAGSYLVMAAASGVASPASFSLMNLAGNPANLFVTGGNSQSTYTNTAFAVALAAGVSDPYGNVVPGVALGFTPPSSGASATLSNAATCTTDATGTCSVTATANGTSGNYNVFASATAYSGLGGVAFSLTNNAAPSFVVNSAADDFSATPSNCPANPSGSGAGSCTLRDAVSAADAAGAGAITFDSSVFSGPTTISVNNLIYSDAADSFNAVASFSITGPAAGVTLDGTSLPPGNPLFLFGMGRTISLYGLTLTNAPAALKINENANVTVTNSTFNANVLAIETEDPGSDGLIPTATVTNSTFSGNANDPGSGQGSAIYANPGAITVSNSTFSNNSAAIGGAIYIGDTGASLTLVRSTFNGNQASGGGALFVNSGTATIEYSTFTGNTATNNGGAIATGGAVIIVNSTISGNSSLLFAGGIDNEGPPLTLTNTILAGNTAPSNPDGIGGYTSGGHNLIGDGTGVNGITNGSNGDQVGTPASPVNPQLMAIGNYGGPTQTMLPVPGSTAICDGAAAGIPSGVTVDQRGYPNTNTSYPGYSSTPCVDAGAVQTNYALAFTQQPSSSGSTATLSENVVISPAPAVVVTESGNPINGATVNLSDAASALTGTKSQLTAAGTATFAGLKIGAAETNDTFGASLALNPSLNVTATSYPFNVAYSAPSLTTPAPGSTLGGTSQLFTWNPGSASLFQLHVGTAGPGSGDVFKSSFLNGTSVNVPSIPANGTTLYVRLWYQQNGVWNPLDYTYTQSGSPTPPALTTPAPGSTLGGTSQMFTWNSGGGSTLFQLNVGTAGVGSGDVFKSGFVHGTSVNVPSIPGNGTTLYVRLWYQQNGVWNPLDYTYTESGSPTPPALTTPAPGSTLGGTSQLFTWNPGGGPTLFQLNVGTGGPGSGNVFKSGFVHGTSVNVPTIPANGTTLYVRLWYQQNGVWNPLDYTYIQSGSPTPPTLTTPTPGSTLGGTSQLFTWNPGAGSTLFQLQVGTTKPGSTDVFKSGFVNGTSVNVPVIPATGATLYVRLWYQLNGVWHPIDYIYTESSTPTGSSIKARLQSGP